MTLGEFAGASNRAPSGNGCVQDAEEYSTRRSIKMIRTMEDVTGLRLIGRNGGIRIE